MQTKEKITIITVHYGDYFWVNLLIKRIKKFTFLDYSIIIVDNARLDDSTITLKSMAPAASVIILPPDHEEISVRGHDHGSSLDAAVQMAQDGIIVVFDSDAHPIRSGWLEWLVGHLQAYDLVAARDDHYDCDCSHPCIACFRKSTLRIPLSFRDLRHDVGRMLSINLRELGRPVKLLDCEKLWADQGRVYESMFYHHGKASWLNSHNRQMLPVWWFGRSDRRRRRIAGGWYSVPTAVRCWRGLRWIGRMLRGDRRGRA